MSDDPSSSKLDQFSHLRRQWASKAQNFRANLNSLESDVNADSVEIAFHDLVQGHKSFRRRSVTPNSLDGFKYRKKKEEEERKKGGEEQEGSILRSYSNEDLGPPLGPAPPPPDMKEETLVTIIGCFLKFVVTHFLL